MDDPLPTTKKQLTRTASAAARLQRRLDRKLWKQRQLENRARTVLQRQLRESVKRAKITSATDRITNARCGGFWLYPDTPEKVAANNKLLLARVAEIREANDLNLPPYALGFELPAYLWEQRHLGEFNPD